MATITAACLLKHRRLIMCRRATLGTTITNKLSNGERADCDIQKMHIVDGLERAICAYKPDENLNCLTNAQVNNIIKYIYTLLPESC